MALYQCPETILSPPRAEICERRVTPCHILVSCSGDTVIVDAGRCGTASRQLATPRQNRSRERTDTYVDHPMSKVGLITRSARGFGRRLAEAVLEHGDRLVATARHPDQLVEAWFTNVENRSVSCNYKTSGCW